MTKVPPLRSTVVTRFFATMGESDSLPGPLTNFGFPYMAASESLPVPQGLPGSSTHPSVRAAPYHPEQPGECMRSSLPHRCQASPFSGRVAVCFQCNEAELGSLALQPARSPHPCGLDRAASAGGVTTTAGLVATCCTSSCQADLLSGRWMSQACPGAPESTETSEDL